MSMLYFVLLLMGLTERFSGVIDLGMSLLWLTLLTIFLFSGCGCIVRS